MTLKFFQRPAHVDGSKSIGLFIDRNNELGESMRCWFVVWAGRRHMRAPVVLSLFKIMKITSLMNINGL